MGSVIGIPTTRVSDTFIRTRLMNQVRYDQLDIFRAQQQLSTGKRFQLPSEDPRASIRVMGLQRLLERKDQVRSNLSTNQSYLSATDTALGTINSILTDVRANAIGVVGTMATDEQRAAAAQQVDEAIRQLMNSGNQLFRGRYLFAGSDTTTRPFEMYGENLVKYNGNEKHLSSYADIDLLFDSNVTGQEVFGAISEPVRGSVALQPAVTFSTPLADIRGGLGVALGSISISDGTHSSIIDLSAAKTVGDVAQLIQSHPPAGRIADVQITSTGLTITLESGSPPVPGDLSINEVAGGTTANELGILRERGSGLGPLVGRSMEPLVVPTTPLANLLGARASAVLRSSGSDNDLIFEADNNGTAYNDLAISVIDDGTTTVGHEQVIYNASAIPPTLTIKVQTGYTTAQHIVAAMQPLHDSGAIPYSCRLDPIDDRQGGVGAVSVPTSASTSGGWGEDFDKDSGLQIVNGGQTYTIQLQNCSTVEDVLNVLNMSAAGVIAEINDRGTGIDIRSRLSGTDFMIGENGGTTAAQLGLRTLTRETQLDDLNHGLGVHPVAGQNDFTITLSDGSSAGISVDGCESIGDVIDRINAAFDPGAGNPRLLTAQLVSFGNGIQLVDDSGGGGQLTVSSVNPSNAAAELGLMAKGATSASAQTADVAATGALTWGQPDDGLVFTSLAGGTSGNALRVVFQDTGVGADTFSYNAGTHTLTFEITDGSTTAADIVNLFGTLPPADAQAVALFGVQLDSTGAVAHDGSGLVHATAQPLALAGGSPAVFDGTDQNGQETQGVFTALVRLREALLANDVGEVQRAIGLLDDGQDRVAFARAGLGARQQGLDILSDRLDSEDTDLRGALSEDYDADFVQAASDFNGRQIAYEASLKAAAQIFQLTLLNYL